MMDELGQWAVNHKLLATLLLEPEMLMVLDPPTLRVSPSMKSQLDLTSFGVEVSFNTMALLPFT